MPAVAGKTSKSRGSGRTLGCHDRALGLLAVRMRSRRELRDRLVRAGFERDEVDDELGRLESVGLVDDERFAEEFAEYHARVKRSGRRAISSALYAKGIARETIERAVGEVSQDDEDARALELARTRAPRLRGLVPETAFQRLSSFLMRRGYAPDLARRTAREALDIDALED